jgi:hypothetical protein
MQDFIAIPLTNRKLYKSHYARRLFKVSLIYIKGDSGAGKQRMSASSMAFSERAVKAPLDYNSSEYPSPTAAHAAMT